MAINQMQGYHGNSRFSLSWEEPCFDCETHRNYHISTDASVLLLFHIPKTKKYVSISAFFSDQ
jgi:hypothetical protein